MIPRPLTGQALPDLPSGQAQPALTAPNSPPSPTPAPRSREKRVTEPAKLAANLARFFNRLEEHAASDPANLVLIDELTEALRTATRHRPSRQRLQGGR
ncbi:hypothetical protein [Streptosporangium sandarakinum]|uniref:hypothetical protein n=1 Tax=Streptosporangium sandarakinum TaxID=1260955 RepID=UPI0037B04F0A